MTRQDRIEAAATVAMHWFDAEGEGKHPLDPDLDTRGMYWLLRDALEGPGDGQPHLRSVA
jgi:hypothetical protein